MPRKKYWMVVYGAEEVHVRFAQAIEPFGAMIDAFGLQAENMSLRQISHPAYLSDKKKKEIYEDVKVKHLSRIQKLRPGHDRLILPGLQAKEGKPKPEEFLV